MFRTLEITTRIGCSNRCVYCPQDILRHAYHDHYVMSYEQFKIILSNTPRDVQIDFTGFCEPFLNPDASLMMATAIFNGYVTVLYTTLSGFTEQDAEILKPYLFREVVFHEFESLYFNREEFERKKKLFIDNIRFQATRHVILEKQWRVSRGSNLWDVPYQKGKFQCGWAEKDFSRNVVLPSGAVYLCCMDYGLKHYLGNLFTQKYDELNRQRIIDLSNKEESDVLCRKCELFRCCT